MALISSKKLLHFSSGASAMRAPCLHALSFEDSHRLEPGPFDQSAQRTHNILATSSVSFSEVSPRAFCPPHRCRAGQEAEQRLSSSTLSSNLARLRPCGSICSSPECFDLIQSAPASSSATRATLLPTWIAINVPPSWCTRGSLQTPAALPERSPASRRPSATRLWAAAPVSPRSD